MESEHRLATVLFADISGFTSMSEKLDPEDLTFLIDRCFGIMETIIEKYDGTIDKFIGDSIMALFGVPKAIEKGPLKAVHTAIEIKNSLYQLNKDKKLPAPLDVHIGINTGSVVAGEIGGRRRREYTVMGDTVNVAAKLEGASHAGQILVGPATYNRTKDRFRFKTLRPIKIEGKVDLFPVYELLSEEKNAFVLKSGAHRSLGSEMVGREKEIGLLECHMQKLVSGKGAIISLTGEAGIGKSRLMAELKQNKIMNQTLLLEGRTNAIGENLSFHPIVDLLKNWSGIKADDSDKQSFYKLDKAVNAVLSEKSHEALPFIATLMGLHLPDAYSRQIKTIEGSALGTLISKSVKELLWKMAAQQPVVMVMEDLHWVDKSSALLLPALFDLVKIRPILFVNLFRPQHGEFIGRVMTETSINFSGHYFDISLAPLKKNQCNMLIGNLLNTRILPLSVKKMVLQRAGGNPFFIEEVLHALIDMGAVINRNGTYKVIGPMEKEIIPQNITDVMMVRIDRLDDKTRQVLRVAAVMGQHFSIRILSAVLTDTAHVNRSIMNLKNSQFIIDLKKRPETEYGFKHALAREVAYHSIFQRTRKILHRRIAAAMETVYKNRLSQVFGMLAFHYSCGEDLEKAERFMIKAGEEALKAGASSEALHYYKEALDIYLKKYKDIADPEKIKMMNKNIARSLLDRGRHAEALEYYTKALTYYGLKARKNTLVLWFGFLVSFCDLLISLYVPFFKWKKVPTQQDIEVLKLLYHRAAAQSSLAPRRFIMESFYLSRRLSRFDLTKFDGGIGMFIGLSIALSWSVVSFGLSRKILAFVTDKIKPDDTRSHLYFSLSEVLQNYYCGSLKNEYDDRLVGLGLKIGEISHTSAYISYHGRIKIERGLYDAASGLVSRLSDIGRTYSHGFSRALKYYLNTKLLMKYRKLHAALIEAEEGIHALSRMDFMQILMVLHLCKVRIHLLSNDVHAAERSLDEVEILKSKVRVLPPYISNYLMSVALLDLFRLETAKQGKNHIRFNRHRKKALASCRRMMQATKKIAHDRPEAYRMMGSCLWLAGRQKAALRHWKNSIVECEHLGARVELARSYMEIGKYLTKADARFGSLEGFDGEHYLLNAERLFSELGLLWDLRELKNIGLRNRAGYAGPVRHPALPRDQKP